MDNTHTNITRTPATKTIHNYQYKLVHKQQLDLSEDEQNKITQKIGKLLQRIVYMSWLNPHTRELLHLEWQRLRTLSKQSKKAPKVSKMSRDYNSSKAGHNQQLIKDINTAFTEAYHLSKKQGGLRTAAKLIKETNLHPLYFVSNERIPIMESHNDKTLAVIDEMNELRKLLVRRVMLIASQLSLEKFQQLAGEVIDYPDLLQVALLAAYDGSLIFDGDRDSVWTSFAHRRIKNSISKFVADNSRTVSVPRNKIDKFGPVREAIDIVGMSDYAAIATETNRINAAKKKESSNRKLKPSEIFTAQKVEEYLTYITEGMSLDNIVNESSEENREIALVETLSKEGYSPEDLADEAMAARSLRRMLRDYLGETRYEIMSLRWGLDEKFPEMQEYNAVMEIYRYRNPGKKLHRIQIKKLEEAVIKQLKEESPRELKELWVTYNALRTRGE